jgi:hypothetical protein
MIGLVLFRNRQILMSSDSMSSEQQIRINIKPHAKLFEKNT